MVTMTLAPVYPPFTSQECAFNLREHIEQGLGFHQYTERNGTRNCASLRTAVPLTRLCGYFSYLCSHYIRDDTPDGWVLLSKDMQLTQLRGSPQHEIVREYSDHGRNGLNIAGREGLNQLMADCRGEANKLHLAPRLRRQPLGRIPGRRRAYYEYVLKRSGIRVHYCAEQFENDGSMSSSVYLSVTYSGVAAR